MKKIKPIKYIPEDQLNNIVEQKYKGVICPSCNTAGIYASCVETEYDDDKDEYILLSFDVFCKNCGSFLGKWDNTNREYFLAKR